MYSTINKTVLTGKTSQFGLSKSVGEVEIGFNFYARRLHEKGSESYFDDDISSLLTNFGMREQRKPARMAHVNNRFNSMPALIHIM